MCQYGQGATRGRPSHVGDVKYFLNLLFLGICDYSLYKYIYVFFLFLRIREGFEGSSTGRTQREGDPRILPGSLCFYGSSVVALSFLSGFLIVSLGFLGIQSCFFGAVSLDRNLPTRLLHTTGVAINSFSVIHQIIYYIAPGARQACF